MNLIDYRTTRWMQSAHPEAKRTTTAEFLRETKEIKSVQLFPDDLVVMAAGHGNHSEILRFQPAMLTLYKYLWDISNEHDKKLLLKHLRRCIHLRDQFRRGHGPQDTRTWYMSIILGSNDV